MPGDWRQGQTIAEDLSDEARVLLVSRPGYGRTPQSSGRTHDACADLYAALLDTLGIEHAVVIGISGGGPSTYAMARRHPHRCGGIVLCCAVQPSLSIVPERMATLARVPGLWRALAALSRLRAPQPDASPVTPAEQEQLADPTVAAALARFHREQPATVRGGALRNDVRQLIATAGAQLDQATVRTVVLHGDLDDVVPLAHAESYAQLVPGAVLEVLPGLGHAVPLFARDRVTAAIRGLLAPAAP